jgi:hypothetical protein
MRKSKTLKTSRPVVTLRSGTEKALASYAAAAAAAGVGVLALAADASAKIIYTPAHVSIPVNGAPVLLDLTGDGTTDFSIKNSVQYLASTNLPDLTVQAGNASNAVWGRGVLSTSLAPKGVFAWALPEGFRVESNESYFQNGGPWVMAWGEVGKVSYTFGQWFSAKSRYLGLKFVIDGEIHYGWARFNVFRSTEQAGLEATLTGYAYDSVANRSIAAGDTSGPEASTLGGLAQGRK